MNEIQTVPIDSVSPDPANVRKHSEKDLAATMGSLRRFGQQHPLVIDSKGVVRAGSGRLEAARRLGWKTIDVVETELSETELAAFSIADNRTAELSGWDVDALSRTLAAIKDEDPYLFQSTGFDDDALALVLQGIDPSVGGELESDNEAPQFEPGTEADQGRLDVLEPKIVRCPHCKTEYDLREYEQG
jgi:ParB-like chromosome segregation protein Spo0J